jgi:hypothetical protein
VLDCRSPVHHETSLCVGTGWGIAQWVFDAD